MGAAIIFKGLLDKEVWKAALPICFGYLFLGSACGVFAQKVGLTVWQSGIMSILVFAGSGQFIAIAMMGGGASILSIVLKMCIRDSPRRINLDLYRNAAGVKNPTELSLLYYIKKS